MVRATPRKVRTQARGRLRRKKLCDAAAKLLENQDLDEISLGNVADLASVPKGSAYHFYGNIYDLYIDLASDIGDRLAKEVVLPKNASVTGWQEVVRLFLFKGVSFLDQNAAGRQLILGPKSPPNIKLSDRHNDYRLGALMRSELERFFVIPNLSNLDRIFYYVIEIADVMFCISVAEHGRVVEEIRDEGIKAAIAYLGLYLPSELPPASTAARVRTH